MKTFLEDIASADLKKEDVCGNAPCYVPESMKARFADSVIRARQYTDCRVGLYAVAACDET